MTKSAAGEVAALLAAQHSSIRESDIFTTPALARWSNADLTSKLAHWLPEIEFAITNLSGPALGMAFTDVMSGHGLTAAGRGNAVQDLEWAELRGIRRFVGVHA